ncbi:hypothetical protein GCM10010387_21230 [Streptomyces inusitatus]|uniref:Uncharacterized protein n=1 Tax=Streptomyces inusitatus TaxID=68221 RepID=A0A918Q1J8_9ACTN|nr:hypothetical protein GCM10010387_21230 [Streptomyces inusitatus]
MCQVGGLEGSLEVRGDPGGVSDDQSGQQRAGVRGEPVGGAAQPGSELSGRALHGGGPSGDLRAVSSHPQDGGEPVVPVERRCEPACQAQPGRGQQPLPVGEVSPGEPRAHHRQYGGPDAGGRPVGGGDPGRLRVEDQGSRRALAADGPGAGEAGVGADRQLHGGVDVLLGQGGQRAAPQIRPVQPGGGGSGGGAEQDRRERGGVDSRARPPVPPVR